MRNEVLAGRYRLEEQLATGGMGTVWRARDEVLQRPVAVKLLHEALADDRSASQRFRREALTAAAITHPHMANVYDYVEEGGRPGIVMELVEGETLGRRLERGRMPIAEAARIASDILTALQAAHDAGIVHRDVKPGNILITPSGQVKVGDFGIARSLGDASLTTSGTVLATPHYIAPEQVRGERATAATDVYSTGVVLYEMLTGRRPFEGDTPIAVATARLTADPPAPSRFRPAIARALERVVMRALARDPAKRFPSATAMREAIDAADRGAPSTQVLEVQPSDETVPLRAMEAHAGARPAYVPPRWAAKRVLWVLLPLLVLGVAALWIVGSLAGSEAPAQTSTPPSPACCAVPDLRGKTLEDAETLLADLGLDLQVVGTVQTAVFEPGEIASQDVGAGVVLARGGTIPVRIAREPSPSPTPERRHRGKGKGDD